MIVGKIVMVMLVLLSVACSNENAPSKNGNKSRGLASEFNVYGIVVGASSDELVNKLGAPLKKKLVNRMGSEYFDYIYESLQFAVIDGKVAMVGSKDVELKTNQDVGVGSSVEQVSEKYSSYGKYEDEEHYRGVVVYFDSEGAMFVEFNNDKVSKVAAANMRFIEDYFEVTQGQLRSISAYSKYSDEDIEALAQDTKSLSNKDLAIIDDSSSKQINIGMEKSKVEEILGRPEEETEFGTKYNGVSIMYDENNIVAAITTPWDDNRAKRFRTIRGITIGSSEYEVADKYGVEKNDDSVSDNEYGYYFYVKMSGNQLKRVEQRDSSENGLTIGFDMDYERKVVKGLTIGYTKCLVYFNCKNTSDETDEQSILSTETAGNKASSSEFSPAPDFSLTDIDGNKVTLSDTNGKVRLVQFFFSNNPDLGPPTTFLLSQVQQKLIDKGLFGTDTEIFSITIDPKRDTAGALKKYAEQFDADLSGWKFLRGEERATAELANNFGVLVMKDEEGNFSQTNLIALVDKEDKIREWINANEYIEGDNRKSADDIVTDIENLL
ncbi:SCO family protein [Cohnella yongneupensis]|uniref:SCO family protein n=1 Tax=Cohnella yongneupensis TaxID=425006 RepID=A0ABW0R1Y2_9BACL